MIFLLFLLLGPPGLADDSSHHWSPRLDSEAASRTYQTLEGLFNYYWKSDPIAEQIKFFFVCGQVGGWGSPHAQDQCSCIHPKACVNCYRWYDAVALESVATYGMYTNSKNHSEMAEIVFDHSPYNGNWDTACTFIDDFTWYGIAYLRVYEWLQVCPAIATGLSALLCPQKACAAGSSLSFCDSTKQLLKRLSSFQNNFDNAVG